MYYNLKRTLVAAALSVSMLSLSGLVAAESRGIVKADALNVRANPSTSATVLTKVYRDDEVSITDTDDGWYKVSVNGSAGWVKSDYVTVTETSSGSTMYISADDVNVREGAGKGYDVVKRFEIGTKVSVTDQDGDWYKVEANGVTGWVYKDYITSKKVSRGDSIGVQISNLAKKQVGKRYIWGGTGNGGFDCSGLVYYVYGQFGVDMNRVAADQADQGETVSSRNSLKPGDLLFFSSGGGIDHVGIYVGDGMYVHAKGSAYGVVSESVWSRTPVKIKRIIR